MNINKLKKRLRESSFGTIVWYCGRGLYHFLFFSILPDKYVVKRGYRNSFGKEINLNAPMTLNEKLQWMKLYDRERWHSFYADKFYARQFFASKFGEEYRVSGNCPWQSLTDIVDTRYMKND